MIEKIGGYRRYSCKKCREGNTLHRQQECSEGRHWVWSWHCIKTPQIGREYRGEYERGDIDDSSYNYNGKLRIKEKPRTTPEEALVETSKPASAAAPPEADRTVGPDTTNWKPAIATSLL